MGPGMASSMVSQGTATGVEATQGVTNATMGAVCRTMGGGMQACSREVILWIARRASGFRCCTLERQGLSVQLAPGDFIEL